MLLCQTARIEFIMTTYINNLETPPRHKSEYMWADYIELLALANIDLEISKADIQDRRKERKDLGEIDLQNSSDFNYEENQDDSSSLFISDCFRNLEYRTSVFGESYPFNLIENGKILQCKREFSESNRLYLFLLLASNLMYVDNKNSSLISSTFEVVSLEALRNYLPSRASTIFFGTNPKNRNIRFSGKLSLKIRNLAEDLNELCLVNDNDFDPHNTGDSGLDLVGYLPFKDNAQGMLYIFCQCACTEEWQSKQHDCSYQSWANKIKFTSFFSHMIFTPFCYRTALGHWFDLLKIKSSILVDRVRIIDLLVSSADSLTRLGELPFVSASFKQKQSLF